MVLFSVKRLERHRDHSLPVSLLLSSMAPLQTEIPHSRSMAIDLCMASTTLTLSDGTGGLGLGQQSTQTVIPFFRPSHWLSWLSHLLCSHLGSASWWKGRRKRRHRPLPVSELPTSNMELSFVSLAATAVQEAHVCMHVFANIFVYTHAPEKHLSMGDSVVMEKPEREY